MRNLIYTIMLMPLAFMACDDKSGPDYHRGKFSWEGTIQGSSATWSWRIRCSDDCNMCVANKYAWPGEEGFSNSHDVQLGDKDKYFNIYQECEGLTTEAVWKTPKLPGAPTPTVPSGKLQFKKHSTTKFGFDSWHDYTSSTDKICYLSIATSDSTTFIIEVPDGILGSSGYAGLYAKISHTSLGFSKDLTDKEHELTTGSNTVKIYSGISGISGEELEVWAYDDPDDPVCLAGAAPSLNYGVEDRLQIHVYSSRIIDSLRFYRINSSSLNPTENAIKQEFNGVLKQAVLEVDAVSKNSFDSTSWDNNNNGSLDLFPNTIGVPLEMREHILLLMSLESQFNDCNSCWNAPESEQEAKVFALPNGINEVWLLKGTATAGEDNFRIQLLNDIDAFDRPDTVVISTWDGTVSESIVINTIIEGSQNRDDSSMAVKLYSGVTPALANTYSYPSVIIKKNRVKGFTHPKKSCAFIDNSQLRNAIHEYLHTSNIGPLSDTKDDKTNIMYYQTGLSTQLRSRHIGIESNLGNGPTEQQLDVLQSNR